MSARKPPAVNESTLSFLEKWSERKLSAYFEAYGGERAGVPKGDEIPFPRHKVAAAVALLRYGAPKYETLAAIARRVGASGALLRLWRTEKRFLSLYRQAVWECADDYLRLLGVSWNNEILAPYQDFQLFFGIALQETILQRLCVDILHMDSEWDHFDLPPKWLAECTLVAPGRTPPPLFSKDETTLANFNTLLLFATVLIRRRIKDLTLAHWASTILMDKWVIHTNVNTELRAEAEKGKNQKMLGLIDFVTARSPLDDVKALFKLVHRKK
jgi:hypothetical protein